MMSITLDLSSPLLTKSQYFIFEVQIDNKKRGLEYIGHRFINNIIITYTFN